MSFILNALRKSEKERLALQVKNFTVDLSLEPTQHKRRQLVVYGVIFIAINVFLTIGIIWFIRKSNVTPNVEVKVISKTVVDDESINKINHSAAISNSVKPEKIYKELKTQNKSTSIEDLLKQETENLRQSPDQSPLINKAAVQEVKTVEHEVNKPSTSLILKDTLIAPVESETKLPFIQDLPFEFQQKVPKIIINVFVYSDQVDECFVMIDGIKYKIGQSLPTGVYIKDMTENSLVVLFQSKVFQIERP